MHPMRALMLIPKDPPPELDGPFSPLLKDFVAACLHKEPGARPSVRLLLEHPLLATAVPAPPDWQQRVAAFCEQPRRLEQSNTMSMGPQASLPSWNFPGMGGTVKADRGRLFDTTGSVARGVVDSALDGQHGSFQEGGRTAVNGVHSGTAGSQGGQPEPDLPVDTGAACPSAQQVCRTRAGLDDVHECCTGGVHGRAPCHQRAAIVA